MDGRDLPPSYSESEKLEAEKAMWEAMNSDNPPSYVMSERDQYYYNMNARMRAINQNDVPEPTAPQASPEDLQRWYQENLEEEQRRELRKQYEDTLRDQIRYQNLMNQIHNEQLRQRLAKQRLILLQQPIYYTYDPMLDDFLIMQFMIRDMPILIEYSWRLNFLILDTAIQAGKFAIPALGHMLANGVRAIGAGASFLSHRSGNSNSNNDDAGKVMLAIAAIAVFLSAGVAAAAGVYYATKKFFASAANILTGNKIARSFVRVSAIVAGAGSGVYAGMVAGAMLGSLIPGFGTLAGAVVGGVLGACINAGIFALVAKYTIRFISKVFNPEAFNPTNPDKYRLTPRDTVRLANYGVHNTSTINQMLSSIKSAKPKKAVYFPSKTECEVNADYNELIKAVKRDPVVAAQGVYLAKHSLFRWSNNQWNQWILPEHRQHAFRR